MDTLNAILTRQSMKNLRPDPLPRGLIERLLEAAVQAPNHYHVRPWRFIVLQGAARERLGDVFAEILREMQPNLPQVALDKERAKPLRAPLIIAVGVDAPIDTRVDPVENICATAAACENLLLAAQALSLGAIWRTGQPATSPRVKAFLGLDPSQPIVAFMYVGYPTDDPQPAIDRPSFEDRTTWME